MNQNNEKYVSRVAIVSTFIANFDILVVLPLIPIAVQQGLIVQALSLGGVLALRTLVSTIISPLWGIMAWKLSHKVSLLLAAIFKAAGFGLLAYNISQETLFAFAVLTGLGTGIFRPVVRSIIADITSSKIRERAFHWLNLSMNLALLIGPLTAELLSWMNEVSTGFYLISALELFFGVLGFLILRYNSGESSQVTDGRNFTIKPERLKFLFRRELLVCYAVNFITYLTIGYMVAMFLLFEHYAPSLVPYRNYLFSLEALAVILAQIWLLSYISKMSLSFRYSLAAVLLTIGLGMSLYGPIIAVCLGLFIYACADAILLPQAGIQLSEHLSGENKTSAYGVLVFSGGAGESAGNLLAGYGVAATKQFSPSYSIWIIAILCGLAIAVLGVLSSQYIGHGASKVRKVIVK